MKAFVIKVKENCYWLGGFYGKDNYDDIAHAKVYVNKTQAEKQCKLVNESYGHNAEVVKITIAEDNLEQQLAEKDKEIERLKQENDKLAFALAEEPNKDELLQLKQDFDILYNKTKERDASIRKQVCDEIRKLAEKNFVQDDDYLCYYLFKNTFYEIIDQIEQAKESIE